MARNYTYNSNQLDEGAQFMVRGRTTWSRLFKPVDGAALARENERRVQRGISPINRPYTTVSVCGAQVIQQGAQMTKEEIYAQEHFYQVQKENRPGFCYDAMNTSTRLPRVSVMDENNEPHEIVLEGELDTDLDVTLVCRVFKSKNGRNQGIALDHVILHEPVRYYIADSAKSNLEKLGLNFHPLPNGVSNRAPVSVSDGQPAAKQDEAPAVDEDATTPFSSIGQVPQPMPNQGGGIRTE